MNWNITIGIAVAALVFVTSALGGHLASTKSWHKWIFWGFGGAALILISVQTVMNEHSQGALQTQLNQIQRNTEQPQKPPVVNVSPPTVIVTPPPAMAHSNARTALFLNCEQVSLPVPFPAFSTIYGVDTAIPAGLGKFSAGRIPGMFPRPDFSGWGLRCDFMNYENEPIFNVLSAFKLNYMEAIRGTDPANITNGARAGVVVETRECEVNMPLIEAKSKFEFYVVNIMDSTHFIELIPPTEAQVELKDKGTPLTIGVRSVKGSRWERLVLNPYPVMPLSR